jgi:uncharacterized membrane protein YbhN (UPF0104 family)
LISNGLVGSIASVLHWQMYETEHKSFIILASVYGVISLVGLGIIAGGRLTLRFRFPFGLDRYKEPVFEGLNQLTRNKVFLIQILCLTIGWIAFRTLGIYLISRMIGEPVTSTVAILLCTGSSLSRLATIFPAGLGIVEAVMSATYVVMGGNLEIGIIISGVDRIVSLSSVVIIGGFSLWISRVKIWRLLAKGT